MKNLTITTSDDPSLVITEQRVILHDVSWETYEKLLTDLADQSCIRLAYDRGTLEIMSPTTKHERYNRTIALLVEILAEELGIDVASLGSSTFKRGDLERGFEPDSCFYIKNAELIIDKEELDLTVDPPPDLVIEVDITSGSLRKFPIYAQLRVPEIWRYDGRRLYIYQRVGDSYAESGCSASFSWLTSGALTDVLEKSKTLKRTALVRSFREMVRQQAPS